MALEEGSSSWRLVVFLRGGCFFQGEGTPKDPFLTPDKYRGDRTAAVAAQMLGKAVVAAIADARAGRS